MNMNVFVQRMVERFGELDEADAVAFAETIIESAQGVIVGPLSIPAERELNLALVFLNMKYPFQCCAKQWAPGVDTRCPDCPMRAFDTEKAAA